MLGSFEERVHIGDDTPSCIRIVYSASSAVLEHERMYAKILDTSKVIHSQQRSAGD